MVTIVEVLLYYKRVLLFSGSILWQFYYWALTMWNWAGKHVPGASTSTYKRGLKLYNFELFCSSGRHFVMAPHPSVWVLWHVWETCHVTRVMWQLATRGCVTVRDRMTLSVMCDITSLMTIITSHNRKAGAWDTELWIVVKEKINIIMIHIYSRLENEKHDMWIECGLM